MKKDLNAILLLIVFSGLYSSCKKDDPASNTDNLCNKNWQMTAATISPAYDFGFGLTTDLYNDVFTPCFTDDYSNFSSNGTYVNFEGATKCDAADPDTSGGNWTWNSDETILITSPYGEIPDSLTITKNDGTTLIGTKSDVENGITYTSTITFKKRS